MTALGRGARRGGRRGAGHGDGAPIGVGMCGGVGVGIGMRAESPCGLACTPGAIAQRVAEEGKGVPLCVRGRSAVVRRPATHEAAASQRQGCPPMLYPRAS